MTGHAKLKTAVVLMLCMVVPVAQAHPGHGAGFVSGVAHPFMGLDHLLAMVAVGLWAAQLGGRALWIVPGAFVATLVAGAALALAGVGIPAVASGVTMSLLVLGILVTLAIRLPVAVGGTIVAAFALFHGYTHGSELPQAASPYWYTGGFVLATIALHTLGMTAGVLWRGRYAWLLRAAGLSVLGGGIWMMAG